MPLQRLPDGAVFYGPDRTPPPKPKVPYTYVPAPHWLWRTRWMRPYDRDVWMLLRKTLRLEGLAYHEKEVTVDQRYIARKLHMSRRSVQRTLARLEAHGLIRKIQVGLNRPNRYRLLDPKCKNSD
jgi:DNA-binding transcriptional ArsR family regulator